MQALRSSPALLRLVLACYLLVPGIATASPVFHPQRMQDVCSADGAMKMVAVDHEAGQHTLDCSLCLAAAWPAPELQSQVQLRHPQPAADAIRARIASGSASH